MNTKNTLINLTAYALKSNNQATFKQMLKAHEVYDTLVAEKRCTEKFDFLISQAWLEVCFNIKGEENG